MKSPMLPKDHQASVRRVLELGRSGDSSALPELIGMLSMPSNEVQRLAASAIGKLADFGADAETAVAALAPLALKGRHPQTQETQVELNKTIEARDGTVVQSEGERRIAEWLTAHGIGYRYDAKFRIIGEFQIRPDFYLPELDVYIEYWGLDTPQYKMSMFKKQTLYQQEGKRLISVYPADLRRMSTILTEKLGLFGYAVSRKQEVKA